MHWITLVPSLLRLVCFFWCTFYVRFKVGPSGFNNLCFGWKKMDAIRIFLLWYITIIYIYPLKTFSLKRFSEDWSTTTTSIEQVKGWLSSLKFKEFYNYIGIKPFTFWHHLGKQPLFSKVLFATPKLRLARIFPCCPVKS